MLDLDSGGYVPFRVARSELKHTAVGAVVRSELFAVGGYSWRLECYPRGLLATKKRDSRLSIFLKLLSKPERDVTAFFEVFRVARDGVPLIDEAKRSVHVFRSCGDGGNGVRHEFEAGSYIRACFEVEGFVTFLSGVLVIPDHPCPIRVPPPSDIGTHFGHLLEEDLTYRKDVSFLVDGETFRAHRFVLAARSPVFMALLYGPMSESTAPCITLHDMEASTFRALLRFLYTDDLPDGGEPSTELFQCLLAAADRYALARLKAMCEKELWHRASVDTVATTLAYAEMYNCIDLKIKCIKFFVEARNCPSIADELKARLRV